MFKNNGPVLTGIQFKNKDNVTLYSWQIPALANAVSLLNNIYPGKPVCSFALDIKEYEQTGPEKEETEVVIYYTDEKVLLQLYMHLGAYTVITNRKEYIDVIKKYIKNEIF
jgi:hypothetical protein